MAENEKDNERLKKAQETTKKLREYLYRQQPADIAEIVQQMDDREDQKRLIKLLEPEDAALVLNELEDSELAAEVLTELPENRASDIVSEMSSDDAADLIFELDEDDREAILDLFEEEDANEVQKLMNYPPDTAGGLMTTEYVAVPAHVSAAAAIEMIREQAPDAETIYYLYVIDSKGHLVGVLSLRELIVAKPLTHISEIMWRDVRYVNVNDDQEDVANIVSKYNFLAIPVVDDDNILRGIITVDDIIDVIHDEAAEDFLRMAGTSLAEDDEDTALGKFSTAVKSRLPWLLITIMGGLCSGQVLSHYESQWSQVIALSFFVPLVIGMGGNVGTQSSTVTVRGIATGNISGKRAIYTVLREASIGISLGVAVGFLVALAAYLWQGSMMIGVIIGLALVCNMLTAATLGTLVPLVLKKLKIDPAVASAPFISTTSDIVGLLIYANLAILILGL